MRDSQVVRHEPHKLSIVGASPAPATNLREREKKQVQVLYLIARGKDAIRCAEKQQLKVAIAILLLIYAAMAQHLDAGRESFSGGANPSRCTRF